MTSSFSPKCLKNILVRLLKRKMQTESPQTTMVESARSFSFAEEAYALGKKSVAAKTADNIAKKLRTVRGGRFCICGKDIILIQYTKQ